MARRTGGWAPGMRACDSAGSGCGLGRCGGKPAGCPEPGWAHGPRGARRRTVWQARRRRRATWEAGRRPCALATRPGTPAAPTRSGTGLTCSPSRFAPLRQGPAASAARSAARLPATPAARPGPQATGRMTRIQAGAGARTGIGRARLGARRKARARSAGQGPRQQHSRQRRAPARLHPPPHPTRATRAPPPLPTTPAPAPPWRPKPRSAELG